MITGLKACLGNGAGLLVTVTGQLGAWFKRSVLDPHISPSIYTKCFQSAALWVKQQFHSDNRVKAHFGNGVGLLVSRNQPSGNRDLRADPFTGEDLQKKRVRHPPIDEMHLADPRIDRIDRGFNFRNHPAGDNPLFD